jgi:hypothetical protein
MFLTLVRYVTNPEIPTLLNNSDVPAALIAATEAS